MNIFFILQTVLIALSVAVSSDTGAAEGLEIPAQQNVKFSIDIADTAEKMAWGLMEIASLPEDHGMLFIYEPPRQASIWMFNVNINLSIAFIDENNVIRELHNAQAFPAMLGPHHRIKNVYALSALSRNDPVVRFFAERSIHSKTLVRYVLEMNKGWFAANNIEIGDVLEWKPEQKQAIIRRLSYLYQPL